jgi:hypothetical protein
MEPEADEDYETATAASREPVRAANEARPRSKQAARPFSGDGAVSTATVEVLTGDVAAREAAKAEADKPVVSQFEVPHDLSEGSRIDRFLRRQLDLPHALICKLLSKRKVGIARDGKPPKFTIYEPSKRVSAGDVVVVSAVASDFESPDEIASRAESDGMDETSDADAMQAFKKRAKRVGIANSPTCSPFS